MKWEKRQPDRIHLSPSEKESLLALAEKFHCYAGSGRAAGSPSYRVLLQRIADGRLRITDPLAPKVFISFKYAPKWWKPDANNSMPADDVAANFGVPIETLIEKGFIKEGDRLRAKWKPYAFKAGVDDVFEPMMTAPDWFVPGERNLMPVADAVKASGMNAAAMMKHGIRVIDGEFVTGPVGSEWAYEVPIPEVQP